MTNYLTLLLVITLAGLGNIHCELTTEVPSYDIEQTIAYSVDRFATDFLCEGATQFGNDTNLFISPYSVYSALDLLFAAAEGTTRDEIIRSLHLRRLLDALPMSEVHKHLGKWQRDQLSEVQSGDQSKLILALANRIFVDKKVQLKMNFVEMMESYYKSKIIQSREIAQKFQAKAFVQLYAYRPKTSTSDVEVIELPFRDHSEESRQKINSWVSDNTRNKIRDLLHSNDVNDLTRMVLANAVYFKGEWDLPFDKADTKNADFYCLKSDESKTSSVPTMRLENQRLKYGIHKEMNVRSLWLPFSDKKTHVVILLPNEKKGLPKLERDLRKAYKPFMKFLKEIPLAHVTVDVYLPRLKIESRVDLKPIFSSPRFNLNDIFNSQKANFNAMLKSQDEKIFFASAIHQAVFEIDEKGATAAASTALTMGRMLPRSEIEFKVDRPFIFFILNEQKTPVFAGRVVCIE